MKYEINMENGIANVGNLFRLNELMRRAEAGEKLTLGFLGGSITMGCLSSTPELCYSYLVYAWWKKTFPNAEFVYINAGIGGTTSQFGAARVEADLLRYKPDFVIVEFSVNDDSTALFLETYEGLVRKIYSFDTKPAVMLVNNVRYNDGGNAQMEHGKVARHYDLPQVSMQSTIYPEVVSGRIKNREITADDLHPNDAGHELVAGVITYFLEQVHHGAWQDKAYADTPERAPLTENQYENSVRYQNYNSTPVISGDWKEDKTKQESITEFFRNGWTAWEKGASITFEIEGSGIAVQYRKSVNQPAPVAEVVIDGNRADAKCLDANFEETWGDCLYIDTILYHGEKKKHTVEITLVKTHANEAVPFYLVSVIGS